MTTQPAANHSQDFLGRAANRYVNYTITLGVIGLILFVIVLLSMRSSWNRPAGFGVPVVPAPTNR